MIIGITGSSSCGKTTVSQILKQKYHAHLIIADEIAKDLSKKGTMYLSTIVKKFGEDILLPDGQLNRKKLADIIYHDSKKRDILNQCTFGFIVKEIEKKIQNIYQKDKNSLIVIDAPLLFEANLQKSCDTTIAVILPDTELQIKRIMKRDQINRKEAIARLNAQPSNEFYEKRCDYVLINDENLEKIEKQLHVILSSFEYMLEEN